MKALPGMTLEKTQRLVEIEHYSQTGQLLDSAHPTDAWVEAAIRFLVEELRPTLEAFGEISAQNDSYTLTAIEARRVCRVWRRAKRRGAAEEEQKALDAALAALDAVVRGPR